MFVSCKPEGCPDKNMQKLGVCYFVSKKRVVCCGYLKKLKEMNDRLGRVSIMHYSLTYCYCYGDCNDDNNMVMCTIDLGDLGNDNKSINVHLSTLRMWCAWST